MGPERFIIADSADMEAEYGYRADGPVTVLEMCEGEVYYWYGATTVAGAKADLIDGGAVAGQISYL